MEHVPLGYEFGFILSGKGCTIKHTGKTQCPNHSKI